MYGRQKRGHRFTMLRGMVYEEVIVPRQVADLHPAFIALPQNPIRGSVKILADSS